MGYQIIDKQDGGQSGLKKQLVDCEQIKQLELDTLYEVLPLGCVERCQHLYTAGSELILQH